MDELSCGHGGRPAGVRPFAVRLGRHLTNPVRVLARAIRSALRSTRFTEGDNETIWAVAGVLIVAWLALRRRWVESVFLGGTLLMALTSGGTGSIPRFVDASPVFLLVLADALDAIDASAVRAACLVGLAGLQIWLCVQWIAWRHFLV